MALKIAYGVIAFLLVTVYLMAPLLKLKDVALGAVIVIGLMMMAIDLVQSIKKDE
jgi:hypothetical protein